MCYNLDLTGLASANKAKLVTALDAALTNVKQGVVPEDTQQPGNKAGSSAARGSAGQVAAADGSAGGSNGQAAMGSGGQAAEVLKGSPEGSGGKVKAWEASTPDAAIEAADSLGYDGLIKLKRVSCH